MKTVSVSVYLDNYNKQQLKRLAKDLKLVKSGFERDDIHRLRVDIKKLNALYHLVELLIPKQYDTKDYIAPFKKLYKHAGEIREAQINLACIKQYKLHNRIVKHYTTFLKEQEKEARRCLKKNIKHLKRNSLDESKPLASSKPLSLQKTEYLLYLQAGIIQNLSHSRLTVTRLHEIRKRLKSLAEIIKLVHYTNPDFLPKALPAVLKQTEALIGRWHDRVILIQSLNSYLVECKPPAPDITAIRKVISALRLQNKAQLKLLKHKLGITLSICA